MRRFTRDAPCPICGGYEQAPRGQGTQGHRCHGFLSTDGRYCHCSRASLADGLSPDGAGTYAHLLVGECRCGRPHSPLPAQAQDGPRLSHPGQAQRTISATYDYRDAAGHMVFQAVRYTPKGFAQRRATGARGWVWTIRDVPRPLPLYRLPELLAADPAAPVFITEGEKDVERLRSLGLVATTNPMGAGKWRQVDQTPLCGRHVVTLPDNDEPGRCHGDEVAAALHGTAASLKVVLLPNLPEHGDVSTWLDAGHTLEELQDRAAKAPLARHANQDNHDNQHHQVRPGFHLTRLCDLLQEPPEDHGYIVQDMLPTGGTSLLAAKPKVGKSTLTRTAAVAVASGSAFLGRATTRGTVLMFSLEEKRTELVRQFKQLAGSDDLPIYVHTGSAPENALSDLAAALEAHRPVALAIVDPLLKLVRVRDVSDYAEVTRALEPFSTLARTTSAHIMFAHHRGKTEREGGDDVLGSTGLFGGVDTLLMMRRHGQQRTIESVQRYGVDLPPTIVTMDPATGLITAGGSVTDLQAAAAAEAVLHALGTATLTEPQLRETAGGNEHAIAVALRALVGAGKVTRTGAGKRGDPYLYRCAGAAPPTTPPTEAPPGFSVSRLAQRDNRETENSVAQQPSPDGEDEGQR